MTTTRHVRIVGRVQGVGYRAWIVVEARRLKLAGWVRNDPDGSVEAAFGGDPDAIEAVLARCREGPPVAKVERVEDLPPTGPLGPGFAQR